MDGSNTFVGPIKPAAVEREMHLVMTGRVASHTIGLNGATQNINVVEIGTSTIDKAISAAGRDIDNIGMVSMDSLFCPYVIGMNWEDHLSLPHWEEPLSGTVTATDLNPFNPAMGMTSATAFYNTGPNLAIYNSVETLGEGDFCQFKNVNENELRLNSVKGVGFKNPIIITGWGYDTNGKPVPADSVDPDAFAADAFRNPAKWKSGPLDVKWDDDRKVWTGGGAVVTKIRFKIVSSDPTTFTALADILAWDAGFGINEVPYQLGTPELPIRVVEVCDPAGCFLNEPAEDLFDRAGWAMLMDAPYTAGGAACREGYGPFPPVWEVIQLCCRPYSCNVDQ